MNPLPAVADNEAMEAEPSRRCVKFMSNRRAILKVDTRRKRILLFVCLFAYLCYVAFAKGRADPIGMVLLLGGGVLVAILLYPFTKPKPTRAEKRRAREEEKRWKKEHRLRRPFP